MPEKVFLDFECVNDETRIPDTGSHVCKKCGSLYKNAMLIKDGSIRKAVPIRERRVAEARPVDFERLPWVSLQAGKDREEAVENLWGFYRRYPGRRRLNPADAYEVTYARPVYRDEKGVPHGGWWLTVRPRRRTREPSSTPAPIQEAAT